MVTQNSDSTRIHHSNGELKETLIVGQTSQGTEVHATLLRLTRFLAVIELYSPTLILRTSEVIQDFRIVIRDRSVYSGRAVVQNLVHAGLVTVCEVVLSEECWTDVGFTREMIGNGALKGQFEDFLEEWQKLYKVLPEFKLVMADFQSFLSDLRLWLDQVELEIRSSPDADRPQIEREVIDRLAEPVVRAMDAMVERFEAIVSGFDAELHPVHRNYCRRQLHPLLLSAPFAYRAFRKPLGFAGDYEMVSMMLRPPYEGSTLFAKVVNVWLLGQAPVVAHRNRLTFLGEKLFAETSRVQRAGRAARILDLGCGPAAEVQNFMRNHSSAQHAHLTLIDFDAETLQYVQEMLKDVRRDGGCPSTVHLVRKSVHQILKEAAKLVAAQPQELFDYIYCAGLFDYLSEPVCRKLMNVFYDQLAPGGLLLATNVSDCMNSSRPFRYSMEYFLDWHLLYRNGKSLASLAPDRASRDDVSVYGEDTGVNVFIEVRKPNHA